MRAIDLTQPFSMHTPGWVGYPSPKISYFQRHHTHGIVSQFLETPLHVSTHLDAEMHIKSGGADIASIPLSTLVGEGVIVDVSDVVSDWSLIRPEHLTRKVKIQQGDILIYHTGWHRFYNGCAKEDEVRYFCMHPGGGRELAEWLVSMKIRWWAFDTGSADHPMNTIIRKIRADEAEDAEAKLGRPLAEIFPKADYQIMHSLLFPHDVIHIENLGGQVDEVLDQRILFGCFPWRFVGGEASLCRLVAFLDV